MSRLYESELEFALSAVRTAAHLCSRVQKEMVLPAVTKTDRSPVTVADFASQAVVARMLRVVFPEVPLVAEEDSGVLRGTSGEATLASVLSYVQGVIPGATVEQVFDWIDQGTGDPEDRFWTLDPIDGTKGFLRGDQYVVALALIEEGQVVLGAMGCPNLNRDMLPEQAGRGSIAYAVRSQGAWGRDMDGGEPHQIKVSNRHDPCEARMLRSFESSHTDPGAIERLAEELGLEAEPVLMDSQAKYGLLAGGHGELLFRLLSPSNPGYEEMIWDQAAGSILVEEAGGRVSDLKGDRLDFSQGRTLRENIGVLASNGHLHELALTAIERVGANRRPQGG